METTPEYQWSDAWLLQAIFVGSGEQGATLFAIIAAGDGLNHAILTNDELEGGFARLTAGGLIEERAGHFFPTAQAQDLYAKATSRPGGIHTVRERLEKALGVAPWQPMSRTPKNTLRYPGFSLEKVREAYNQWHREARRLMAKRRRTKPDRP